MSTYVVEQLSFSFCLSILTFDFDLILGSFLTFWGPNGLFLGSRLDKKKTCFGVYSFSMFNSILTFDFELVLGSFVTFWVLIGYFWDWGRI